MSVKIKTPELLEILEHTPPHHNIMLVGKHGIGKSKIVEGWYTRHGMRVVSLFLGQMSDPGDLIGLPFENAASGRTEFHPPYWWPIDSKPIVLFLDELNRARPEILQCVMDLTLNKTLAGRALPEGSRVVSAVNEGEEYQLTDIDPALASRFNIYTFAPTVAEWLLWATENHIDTRVTAFIEQNPDCLDSPTSDDAGLDRTPDRRAWQRVAEWIAGIDRITAVTEKAIAGIIGVAAALKFVSFVKATHGLTAMAVLKNFTKCRNALEKLQAHELSVINEGMFRLLETEENAETVKAYITNLEKYVNWLTDSKRNEVMAHWTTLYDSDTYPRAKIAILTSSPTLFTNITKFINSIKL